MGEVYRARHTLLARDSALKLIRRDPTAARDTQVSASRLERRQQLFFDEARRLASLHSLHTVAVQDFGVAENGRYFLVMELLEGLDLATLVERYGPQPAGRVASILAQVCDSLAEAHDAGFVHQDIKPANIFLCRIAEALDFVKVLDFGLARKFGAGRDEEGRLEGAAAFRAPEQVQELAVGPAADFYGLGGVGFFLLTGKPPYDTRSRTALFYQHVHGEVPQLPEPLRASVPAELAELLTQCLAKDPAARPASARDLAASFHRLASASPLEFGDAERERFWKEWEAAGGGQAQGTPIPRHDVSRSLLKVRFDSAYSIRREGA